MTSAFGGQHSIQLSYGCIPAATAFADAVHGHAIKKTGSPCKASPPLGVKAARIQARLPTSIGRCSARWDSALSGSMCRALAISWT